MPRDILILSREQPEDSMLVDAGRAVDPALFVRPVDDFAVIQLCTDDGTAVLSVSRPEWMRNPAEIDRLAPAAAGRIEAPLWWIPAWAPWGAAGDVGIRIAYELTDRLNGFIIVADGS